MTSETFRSDVQKTIPHRPGVYRYFDDESKILYVGKAKDLRKRVSSYFSASVSHRRTKALVRRINTIEFTVVETEKDALLLENSLIKKLQPPYNILLKSDVTFPYICIVNEPFSRVILTRNPIKNGSQYFGPYTSMRRARVLLEMVQKIFQIRSCSLSLTEKNISAGKFKICLEYHLGNCLGPCEGRQSEEHYNLRLRQVKRLLQGHIKEVISLLTAEMQELAEKYEFERAEQLRQKIELLRDYKGKATVVNPAINNVDVFAFAESPRKAYINFFRVIRGAIIQTKILEITKSLDETREELLVIGIQEFHLQFGNVASEVLLPFQVDYPDEKQKIIVPKIGDKKKLVDLCTKNVMYYRQQRMLAATGMKQKKEMYDAVAHIQTDFRLRSRPVHIECIDNSNFQGSFPVASLVVFKNGKPSKKDYRHFNIKTVVGPDDFASMTEVVLRRYGRLVKENKALPQLLVVDGGKGQLSAAMKAIDELGLRGKLAVAGIAKKLEEIYLPNDPIPLHIDKKSPGLKVIQQMRNEAHRFAITFHRNKRSKAAFKTELSDIPGIGSKTVELLLRHFKTVRKVQEAKEEALLEIVNKRQANNIIEYFSQEKN